MRLPYNCGYSFISAIEAHGYACAIEADIVIAQEFVSYHTGYKYLLALT